MFNRKILNSLQPAANDENLLVSGNGFVRPSKTSNVSGIKTESAKEVVASKCENNRKRCRAKKTTKSLNDGGLKQTTLSLSKDNNIGKTGTKYDVDAETISWITNEVPPENYWKELAEQRRLALLKALDENESLIAKLKACESENEKLKNALNEVLEEAKELISFHEDS